MLVNTPTNIYKAVLVTGKKLFGFITLTTLASLTFDYFEIQEHMLPSRPVGILTAAVGIFLAFRIHIGYSRWWEARHIWGRIVVDSRNLAMCLKGMLATNQSNADSIRNLSKRIILRNIAFINAVRLQLRMQSQEKWDEEIWNRKIGNSNLLPREEVDIIKTKANKATYIHSLQGQELSNYFNGEYSFQHVKLLDLLNEIFWVQGKSELIKATPLAWGYKFYTRALAWTLSVMLIFSQNNAFTFQNILLISLISTVFITVEQVGRNLDTPFEDSFNDTPMSAICRIIEIDTLGQIDEPCDLKPMTPVNGVLS